MYTIVQCEQNWIQKKIVCKLPETTYFHDNGWFLIRPWIKVQGSHDHFGAHQGALTKMAFGFPGHQGHLQTLVKNFQDQYMISFKCDFVKRYDV